MNNNFDFYLENTILSKKCNAKFSIFVLLFLRYKCLDDVFNFLAALQQRITAILLTMLDTPTL